VSWFGIISRCWNRPSPRREPVAFDRSRQLADAREGLTRAAELASVLEKEILSRQATLEAIEADIAAHRAVASIDQGQAASLAQLVEAATRQAHQRLLRASRLDQITFFLAGVIMSTVVQLLMSWL
jgi:hypothetical protein